MGVGIDPQIAQALQDWNTGVAIAYDVTGTTEQFINDNIAPLYADQSNSPYGAYAAPQIFPPSYVNAASGLSDTGNYQLQVGGSGILLLAGAVILALLLL